VADSHEPSYYEIALTNRQVVVAFVILMVCLVSAFFSGIWIGRESANRAQDQMAQITPPPEVKQEGESVEDLSFFDQREKPAQSGDRDETERAPAKAAGDSTLLEDFGGGSADRDEPAAPRPAPPVARPTPAAEPLTAAERKAARRAARRERLADAEESPAPTPSRPPASARTPPVPAATPARAAASTAKAPKETREPEPAVSRGSMVIQVFSSSDRAQADRIRKQLVGGGQKAYLSPVEVAGHTMYRVRIGPFSSRPDAQKVADKVRKSYKLDTWITE
jgi:cell division septation protein DedD